MIIKKFKVTLSEGFIEFPTEEEANTYCNDNSLALDSVSDSSEDITDLTSEELAVVQQTNQQQFGAGLSLKLVNLMGGRNLYLAELGTPVDIVALLTALGTAKTLMDTGALKTARGYINAVKAGFPLHLDITNLAVEEITAFLVWNGYE